MTCEKCQKEMNLQYDVEERSVIFVLWDCECGHKLLERRPHGRATAAAAPATTSSIVPAARRR